MHAPVGSARATVTAILAGSAAILGAILLLMWLMQERIAYQPQGPPYPDARSVTRIEYTAEDGQPLFGYVVGDPAGAPGVVLAFHGNADLAAWQIEWAEDVRTRTGYAVFLPEYRGYMGLPGRPTYAGLRLDARAAHATLTSRLGVPSTDIAIFGHSLGTAVATELANERPPRALLLQAPFTSTRDMAGRMVSEPLAALLQFVTRIPYDTRARVSRMDVPVWVIHGSRDLIIPARMGQSVYSAVKRKGAFVMVEGAGHNDISSVGNDRYWKWMTAALDVSVTAGR